MTRRHERHSGKLRKSDRMGEITHRKSGKHPLHQRACRDCCRDPADHERIALAKEVADLRGLPLPDLIKSLLSSSGSELSISAAPKIFLPFLRPLSALALNNRSFFHKQALFGCFTHADSEASLQDDPEAAFLGRGTIFVNFSGLSATNVVFWKAIQSIGQRDDRRGFSHQTSAPIRSIGRMETLVSSSKRFFENPAARGPGGIPRLARKETHMPSRHTASSFRLPPLLEARSAPREPRVWLNCVSL